MISGVKDPCVIQFRVNSDQRYSGVIQWYPLFEDFYEESGSTSEGQNPILQVWIGNMFFTKPFSLDILGKNSGEI